MSVFVVEVDECQGECAADEDERHHGEVDP